MSAQRVDRARLLKVLIDHFTEDELNTLCFELHVDYDGLDGEGKISKARELIRYYENRSQLSDLVIAIQGARPNLELPTHDPVSAPATSESTTPAPSGASTKFGTRTMPKTILAVVAPVVLIALIVVVGLAVMNSIRGSSQGPIIPIEIQLASAAEAPTGTSVDDTEQSATPVATSATTHAGAFVVDDFEEWTDPLPDYIFMVNRDGGNDGHVSMTADSGHVGHGEQSLVFSYAIGNADANPSKNYIGFDRVFSPQDWSIYNQFCAWIEPDEATRWISLGVSSGYPNIHDKLVQLKPGVHEYCVPLRPTLNDTNLQAITSYRFYLGAPFAQKGGSIYIDHVRLLP